MEENVALDSSKQKQFVKSVRGIKKLLKRNTPKSKDKEPSPVKKPKVAKETIPSLAKEPDLKELKKSESVNENKKELKKGKNKLKKIQKRPKRGLVYLSHIPHGFYENQMTEYFKQFGVVTNARVIRSKRTGNSKGYAFVEFKEPTVAEIVADTMNNYLMGKRLIKALYVPPKKQKLHALRKNWNIQANPASEKRLKMKKVLNSDKTEDEELKIAKKLLSTLSKTKKKLSGLGIEYDFFVPVDIPAALNDNVSQIDNKQSQNKEIKTESVKIEEKSAKKESKVNKINNVEIKKGNNKNKSKEIEEKKSIVKQQIKENKNTIPLVNKKEQKIKQQKLNEKGIKGPENFININDSNDDDGSSDGFDSDEFEKMIDSDNDDLSGDDSDESSNEEENSQNVMKIKKNVTKKEKNMKKNNTNVKSEQQKQVKTKAGKRKNIINAPVVPKKAKFEKQNKKTLSKVVKVKK